MSDDTQKWVKVNDDGSVTVTLSRPASIDGASAATLTLREPSVHDQLISSKTSGNELEKEIALLANLISISKDDVLKLPARDYMRLQAAFANFTD